MLDSIVHTSTLLVLTSLAFLTGYLLEHCIPSFKAEISSLTVVRIANGLACWIAILFVLAAVGQLRVLPVSLLALAAVAAAVMVRVRNKRRTTEAATSSHPNQRRLWLGGLLFTAPAVVVAGLFLNQLYPAVMADDAVYHLTLPRLYVEAGGFRNVPLSLFAMWPQNTELLYALAMLWNDYIAAKLVSWLFACLLVISLARFSALRGSATTAAIALCLLLANPTVLFEAGSAYVDLAIGFWAFIAFDFLCQYIERPSVARIVACGIFSGIAAGSKMSGAFVGIALASVLTVESLINRHSWHQWLRAMTILCGLTALIALPWYLRSVIHTGSPAFPMGFGTLPVRPDAPYWSARLNEQFWNWQINDMGMGRTWKDYVRLPYRVIANAERGDFRTFDGRLNPAWIGLLPLSLLVARVDPWVRRAMTFACSYFVLWALGSQQIRLLLPMLPHAAFACASALCIASQRVAIRQRFRAVPGLALAVIFQIGLLWVSRYVLHQAADIARRHIAGPPITRLETISPVYDFLNADTPPDARVMILNSSETFFLNREFAVDSTPHASQLADMFSREPTVDGVGRTLSELGATYIVVFKRNWEIPYPEALTTFLNDRQRAKVAYVTPDQLFTVWEVVH